MDYMDLNFDLQEEDLAIKKAAHKFAKDVMRPIAKELDQMTPEEVIAKGSPFWNFMRKGYELGYHSLLIPDSYGGMGLDPLHQYLVFEQLAWGSVGLTVALGVSSFPAFLASMVPEEGIIDEIITPYCQCKDASILGCWAITEPDHGSDTLMPGYPSFRNPQIKSQCTARLKGDEWVINGQKSAWVSCGSIATHATLFCQIDPSMGHAGGGIAIVPLDQPGVSRGKPLDKLGQRDLNQGEIFFDDARIPKSYMLVESDAYEAMLDITLASTTVLMGTMFTGVARAAFEETLIYAKERVQGGKPLVDHTNVKMRLFDMFTRVEASRQLSRAVWLYNSNVSPPASEYSMAAKIFSTESAYQIAHEAIQIFGGNGLTKEYLIEKLYRDARASLIEDGSNDILAIAGGHTIVETYPRY